MLVVTISLFSLCFFYITLFSFSAEVFAVYFGMLKIFTTGLIEKLY